MPATAIDYEQAIAALFPDAVPNVDYVLFDGGDGIVPVEWDVTRFGAFDAPTLTAKVAQIQAANAQAALIAYARAASYAARVGGTTINGVPVKTDADTISLVNGMADLAKQDSSLTFQFDTGTGTAVVSLTAAEAIAFSTAIGTFVQSTFAKRAQVLAGIAATPPTVTTTAQIDAAFAAVAT